MPFLGLRDSGNLCGALSFTKNSLVCLFEAHKSLVVQSARLYMVCKDRSRSSMF